MANAWIHNSLTADNRRCAIALTSNITNRLGANYDPLGAIGADRVERYAAAVTDRYPTSTLAVNVKITEEPKHEENDQLRAKTPPNAVLPYRLQP